MEISFRVPQQKNRQIVWRFFLLYSWLCRELVIFAGDIDCKLRVERGRPGRCHRDDGVGVRTSRQRGIYIMNGKRS